MMGWGYRKRKIFGTRWLHMSINATQKGPSSVGFKVLCFSWNSRTKAVRFDGPGGLYWQQKKGRQPRGGRGKSTGGGPRGSKAAPGERQQHPIRGGPVGFGARWVRRGGTWTAMQASERSSGYAKRVTGPFQEWLDDRREFGPTPLVRDFTTGEKSAAASVTLPWHDATFGPRDRNMAAVVDQMRRDEDKRIALAFRPLKLSWLERAAMRARGEDPLEFARKWHATDVAVMQLRSQRIAAAGAAIPFVEATGVRNIERATAARKRREARLARAHRFATPGPVAGIHRIADLHVSAANDAGTEVKEAAVANAVRTFADLHDPDIDPKEFPEELPAHLEEVRALIASRVEELQGEADRGRGDAEAMVAYVDYFVAADADRELIAHLHDAMEAVEAAAAALRTAAEAMDSAGDGVAAAKARAEAKYGDWDVPDFWRAG